MSRYSYPVEGKYLELKFSRYYRGSLSDLKARGVPTDWYRVLLVGYTGEEICPGFIQRDSFHHWIACPTRDMSMRLQGFATRLHAAEYIMKVDGILPWKL